MTGLRRDGHLTDLALEYYLDGEPLDGTQAHVETCAICKGRLDAARGTLVPPQRVRRAVPRWAIAAVPLAMAAGALFMVAMQDDGIHVKGGGVDLHVFRDEGPISRRLWSGDEVAPGDRLGFRVRVREPGHIMVVGTDGFEAYLGFPQAQPSSIPFEPSEEPIDLDTAIRLDDTLGTERLVLLWCDAPFTLDLAAQVAVDDEVPPSCLVDVIELEKR